MEQPKALPPDEIRPYFIIHLICAGVPTLIGLIMIIIGPTLIGVIVFTKFFVFGNIFENHRRGAWDFKWLRVNKKFQEISMRLTRILIFSSKQ